METAIAQHFTVEVANNLGATVEDVFGNGGLGQVLAVRLGDAEDHGFAFRPGTNACPRQRHFIGIQEVHVDLGVGHGVDAAILVIRHKVSLLLGRRFGFRCCRGAFSLCDRHCGLAVGRGLVGSATAQDKQGGQRNNRLSLQGF